MIWFEQHGCLLELNAIIILAVAVVVSGSLAHSAAWAATIGFASARGAVILLLCHSFALLLSFSRFFFYLFAHSRFGLEWSKQKKNTTLIINVRSTNTFPLFVFFFFFLFSSPIYHRSQSSLEKNSSWMIKISISDDRIDRHKNSPPRSINVSFKCW